MADRRWNRWLAHIATLMGRRRPDRHGARAISLLEEHRDLARPGALTGIEFPRCPSTPARGPREKWGPWAGPVQEGRAGEITHFTGIDSPYQRPKNP